MEENDYGHLDGIQEQNIVLNNFFVLDSCEDFCFGSTFRFNSFTSLKSKSNRIEKNKKKIFTTISFGVIIILRSLRIIKISNERMIY